MSKSVQKDDKLPPLDNTTLNSDKVRVEQLISPLLAALTPQLGQLIAREFDNREMQRKRQNNPDTVNLSDESEDEDPNNINSVHCNKIGVEVHRSSAGEGRAIADLGEATGGPRGVKRGHSNAPINDTNDDDGPASVEYNPSDNKEFMDPLSHSMVAATAKWKPAADTSKYLESYMKRSLSKEERNVIVSNFPLPIGNCVVMPRVYEPFINLLKQTGIFSLKNVPGLFSVESIQYRLLDSMGPLSALHSACHDAMAGKEAMDPRYVLEAVSNAICLLGNANAQACLERRKAVIRKVNPGLLTQVSRCGYDSDSTDLFGCSLRKSIKESIDLSKEVSGIARAPAGAKRGRFTYRGGYSDRMNRFEGFSRGGGRGYSRFTRSGTGFRPQRGFRQTGMNQRSGQ